MTNRFYFFLPGLVCLTCVNTLYDFRDTGKGPSSIYICPHACWWLKNFKGQIILFLRLKINSLKCKAIMGKIHVAGFNLGESSNTDISKFHFCEQWHVEMLSISHSCLPPIIPVFLMFHSINTQYTKTPLPDPQKLAFKNFNMDVWHKENIQIWVVLVEVR